MELNNEIALYNEKQQGADREICELLSVFIQGELPDAESKVWHGHPVWFFSGNPIVGYDKLKESVRLMFWSGADFGEEKLQNGTGKFKDASIRYTMPSQIDFTDLKRWLTKAREIQWDYKNIVKRKGKLERLG